MIPQEILDKLAPCGLFCGNCLAYADGPIQRAAAELSQRLGPNFANYAERFENMNPVFAEYAPFARVLHFLAQGTCASCRREGCLFQACAVPGCIRVRNVDFCFQCPDFPCAIHGLPGPLAERWRRNNGKMRDMGVEAYFLAFQDKPRYP